MASSDKFPKELRYNLIQRVDKKIALPFVLSFLVLGGIVFGLSFVEPKRELTEKDVLKIKQRYAKLDLNKPKEEVKKPEPVKKQEIIPEKPKPKPKIDRENETKEERQARKEETKKERAQVREDIKKNIEESGLFAELTAMGDGGDNAIDDVIAKGEAPDLADIDLNSSGFTAKPGRKSTAPRERKGERVESQGLGRQKLQKAEVKRIIVEANVEMARPEKIEGAGANDANRTAKSIESVIAKIQSQIKMQFEKYLRQDPNLGGKVEVEFTINADGTVASVQVAKSTLNHSAFERRLLSMIKRLKFPPASDKIDITYPFVFSASKS